MSCSSFSSVRSSPLPLRSITPLSDVSSFIDAPSFPRTFVLLDHGNLEPGLLRDLVGKHAETGSLGLVVGRKTGFLQTIPYITTTKEHAAQLNTISSAGLRSAISAPLSETETLYILEHPPFSFAPLSAQRAFAPGSQDCQGNIPTPDEWRDLWNAWDLVTLQMIPEEMLHQKLIDLRHKCLFYIGHIPTFLDMLLSKAIGGNPSEPVHFWKLFERGIDPHVDDPTHCHNHSEVPDKEEDWPTLDSIIAFRDCVRKRLMKLYEKLQSGQRTLSRNIARTLVMTLEHEGFHVETLLYMLIQRAGTGTLPPPGFHPPEWTTLSKQWTLIPPPSTPCTPVLGPTKLTVGHDDSEADDNGLEDVVNHTYGWDNESPARVVEVGPFKAEWRPISNEEYLAFWKSKDGCAMPKSWVEDDGEIKVRTLYGYVSMDVAGEWPVLASYDELEAFARFKGGRLPTEPELRVFLDTYDVGHEGGANVGFRNWHPVPSTMGIDSYQGRGCNGGVWEWTSTLFIDHEGLVPTKLFTGYSTDFFDTKHHVVLGASYATIPRLSRKTVRNFYQHNYPYPWVGARVVYDVAL